MPVGSRPSPGSAGLSMPRGLQWLQVCLCLLLFFLPFATAQITPEWPPVPKSDLEFKDNPADPGAPAMILEREVYTDDDKRFQTTWVRIKVLTEEGRKYADVEIPYVAKTTSVEDIRARTVRPDGTEITFRGDVFDKVVVKYKKFRYQAKTFTLVGVGVGSILDYKYRLRWKESVPDAFRNPSQYIIGGTYTFPTATWTLQEPLFTRHARFTLRPARGATLRWAGVRLPSGVAPVTAPDGIVRMELNSIMPLEQEKYMPPEEMLNSRVHFYYLIGSKLFSLGSELNFWASYGSRSAKDWDKFVESIKSLARTVVQVAPPGDAPELRLRKIYASVQQIRNLSYEPNKSKKELKREHLPENKSAEDILRRGYGLGNELNFLFTALARAAGFQAWPVEIVDRSRAQFEPEVLDTSQLDAMVVMVTVDGKPRFFDPATSFCPFGVLPWYKTDTNGVSWDKVQGQIVSIPSQPSEVAVIERIANLTLKSDGGLDGSVEVVFSGEEALERRLDALNEDEAGRHKQVEQEISNWIPAGGRLDITSITGWEGFDEPLRVKCRIHVPRFAQLTSSRLLFPMAVFHTTRRTALRYSRREQPVYFGHSYRTVDRIAIVAPAGYQIEGVPADFEEQTAFASFRSTYTRKGQSVDLERQSDFNAYFFPLPLYGQLVRYMEQLRLSDLRHVVLHEQMH